MVDVPSNEQAAPPESQRPTPLDTYRTPGGMVVTRYAIPLEQIPADFYADPDGAWTYEALVAAAGFEGERGVAIGALRHCFNDHPDGSAVVTLEAESRPYVAIIECPVAYACAEATASSGPPNAVRVSAA